MQPIVYRISPNFQSKQKQYVLEHYNPTYDQYQPRTSENYDYNRYHEDRTAESSPHSEINLVMDKLGGDTNCNDIESGAQPKKSRRRHLLNNLYDFIAIAATCLIFGLIYLLIEPNQRGFFCDDTSIQYPMKKDTIPLWVLGIYGGIGPIVIMCIVEIWVVRPFNCGRRTTQNSLKQRRIDYFKTIIQSAFLFALGIAICFLITEVGKRTIGRLRPYYLTLCNPVWANLECTKNVTTKNGQIQVYQYITDHQCNSTGTQSELREAKLSFPSGHSSYATYAFVFLFVYFEARLVCPNIQFLKPVLQCLCIAVAFFTCLSRVTDYKHHATDVIGGSIIGFCIAVFAAVRIGTYLWSFSVYCETEDETKKDRLPQNERVSIPGIETRQTGALRSNEQHTTTRPRHMNSEGHNGQRNLAHSISPGGKRVAPAQRLDETNG